MSINTVLLVHLLVTAIEAAPPNGRDRRLAVVYSKYLSVT